MNVVKQKFFRAAFWHYEGRDVRLTEYEERDMPRTDLFALAFARAKEQGLTPLWQRIQFGEFLRV